MLINLRSDEKGTSPIRFSLVSSPSASSPAFRAATIKRTFRGVALHYPASIALHEHGVIRSVAGGESADKLEPEGPFNRFAIALSNLAGWRVSGTSKRHAATGGHNNAYGHFILGKCTRFIGGDDIGRSQSLDCRKMTHDSISSRHALYTEGKNRRHNGRQSFRHCSDG